jgi:prepilin-type N-terminal cleavage/methylation domain-containing protein
MKSRKAFTLIEVLIVVIILGVLATIAIPQFTKVAKRARLAEAWTNLSAIRTAQSLYYMENATYTTTLGNLDVSLTSPNFAYTIPTGTATAFNILATGNATATTGITAWIHSNGASGSAGI